MKDDSEKRFEESLRRLDENLPNELKKKKIFCVCEPQNDGGRRVRLAFNPESYKIIRSFNYTDSQMYGTMEEMERHLYPVFPERTLAVAMLGGVNAIELDQCIREDGQLDKTAADIIRLMDSYSEVTPGGAGIRILFKTNSFQFDERLYNTINAGIGLEVYLEGHTDRCAGLTGEAITKGLGLEDRSEKLLQIMDRYMKKNTLLKGAMVMEKTTTDTIETIDINETTGTNEPVNVGGNDSGSSLTRIESSTPGGITPSLGTNPVAGASTTIHPVGTTTSPKQGPPQKARRLKLDDFELNMKAGAAKDGQKFKDLMSGSTAAHGGNHLKAVEALIFILAYWSRKNPVQMDRIFRTSKLMWPGWDNPDANNPSLTVGQVIIQNANATVKNVYVPQAFLMRGADELTIHTPDGDILLSSFHPELHRHDNYGWDAIGTSLLFSQIYVEECRYVAEPKDWFCYDGTVWEKDHAGAEELAKEFVMALASYARALPQSKDDKDTTRKDYIDFTEGLKCRKARENLLKDASSINPLHMDDFDRNPYLLNCQNGTLDLESGILYQHDPGDLLTKMAGASFDPGMVCKRWEKHIDEVFEGDKELVEYTQKALGYALTGDTKYECFFILYGSTTRNGKTTTLTTVNAMLGDYSKSVQPESIATKSFINGSSASDDIARLAGSRFISISEPGKKMPLNAALVKALTGGNVITARKLYESSFEFKLDAKMFIDTNHLPYISDLTIFRSNRIKVIPFNHRFIGSGQDKNLKQELLRPESLSGILNWCLEGLRTLKATGFDEPVAVKNATAEYENDSDKISRFIDEHLVENVCGEILTDDAYQRYKDWCAQTGTYMESQMTFKQSMQAHGAQVRKKRPSNQSLGKNPRWMIIGFSFKAKTIPSYGAAQAEPAE